MDGFDMDMIPWIEIQLRRNVLESGENVKYV